MFTFKRIIWILFIAFIMSVLPITVGILVYQNFNKKQHTHCGCKY